MSDYLSIAICNMDDNESEKEITILLSLLDKHSIKYEIVPENDDWNEYYSKKAFVVVIVPCENYVKADKFIKPDKYEIVPMSKWHYTIDKYQCSIAKEKLENLSMMLSELKLTISPCSITTIEVFAGEDIADYDEFEIFNCDNTEMLQLLLKDLKQEGYLLNYYHFILK